MAETIDSFASDSASVNSVREPPGIATDSASANAFSAATKFGILTTDAVSRNLFELDNGFLATGRFRR